MEMAQDPLQETIDYMNNLIAQQETAEAATESAPEAVEAASSDEAESSEPVAQEAQAEAPAEEVKEQKPEGMSKDFTRRFAQLARRERSFRDRQDEFKKMQAELAELREKSSTPDNAAKELAELRRIAAENPRELLARLDLDYQKLNESILSGDKRPEDYRRDSSIDKLLNRIDELESKLSKREEQEVVSRQEKAYNNFIDEIRNFVETNNEDFEKIANKYRDSFGNEAKSEAPRQPDSRPKTLSNSIAAVGTTTDGEVHSKPMTRDEHKAYLARTLNFFGE